LREEIEELPADESGGADNEYVSRGHVILGGR
jgi:hypothetical protein